MKEGDEADAEVANSQKRTTSRRELARNPRFEQVSPEVGELDESAVEEGLREDPDEMLAMLADLVGATDRRLRETHGLDERTMTTLETVTAAGGSLWRLPMSNILLGMRLRSHLPAGASPAVLATAKARVLLGRRILFHNRIRELFHYWHVIHKPFAFLMLIIMVVHVGVTVALGYRWVF